MNLLAIVWDPKLGFDLGFFTIRYYSLMFVIGFGAGYYIMKKVFEKEHISYELLDPLLMYIGLGTILGARLGHVFFYDWDYFKHHLDEILLPIRHTTSGIEFTGFQGLASHGATIGVFIALILFWKKYLKDKKSFLWLLDRVALTIPLGGALVRIGNLLNSEIIGKPTGTDYGFIFKQLGEDFPRHPTQIYEAIAYLILFFIMLYLYWKTGLKKYQGMLFGIFFTYLWIVRFFIEFYKEPQKETPSVLMLATGLNTGQLLSIPFALAGILLIIYSINKHKKQQS